MSLTLVSGPAAEPLTAAEAKAWLRVTGSSEDTLISSLIVAARELVEKYLERDLVERTWDWSIDGFPYSENAFELPRTPVQSITSITYVNGDSPEPTLATTVYGLDNGVAPPLVYLLYNQQWPAARFERNAVTIRFVSGYASDGSPIDYAANIPEPIKHGMLMLIADMYRNREAQVIAASVEQNPVAQRLLDFYRVHR